MSEKESLLRVRSPGQGEPAYCENTATGERAPTLGPTLDIVALLFDAINSLDKRLTELEAVVVELGAMQDMILEDKKREAVIVSNILQHLGVDPKLVDKRPRG